MVSLQEMPEKERDDLRSRVVTACARAIGGGDRASSELFDFDAGDAAIAAYRASIVIRGKG